ncbi:hypothetical protein BsWGS_27831 [Bradybaena similaris]
MTGQTQRQWIPASRCCKPIIEALDLSQLIIPLFFSVMDSSPHTPPRTRHNSKLKAFLTMLLRTWGHNLLSCGKVESRGHSVLTVKNPQSTQLLAEMSTRVHIWGK